MASKQPDNMPAGVPADIEGYQAAVVKAMGAIYGVPPDIALAAIVEQPLALIRHYEEGQSPAFAAADLRPEVLEEYEACVISFLTSTLSKKDAEASAFVAEHKAMIQDKFERHIPPEDWVEQVIGGASVGVDVITDERPKHDKSGVIFGYVPSEAVCKILDQLVDAQIFGISRDVVMQAMVARGIEAALPVLALCPAKKK